MAPLMRLCFYELTLLLHHNVMCVSSNPQEYTYATVPQPNELNATTDPATQTTTVPHSTVQYNFSTGSISFGSVVPTLPSSSIDLSFTTSVLYIKPGKLKLS